MKKVENLINYLKAKKPKDKKQKLIQWVVGTTLGLSIGFIMNKQGFENGCKKTY